jgi:hypothetical protein
MNYLSIDGVELALELSQETSLNETIRYLKESLVSERALISLIRINGNDVIDPATSEIGSSPISQLNSIEIFTSHPRELADETLQHLAEYSHILENLSRTCGELAEDPSFHGSFVRLIEGITTFTEAIAEVKKILKASLLQSVNVLEADLLSILKDILMSQQQKQTQYMTDLLKLHLPENLKQWRETGIPDLIHLQDC